MGDLSKRVAGRYLQSRVREKLKAPFEYERAHVPHPLPRERARLVPENAPPSMFQSLPWWARSKNEAPDPERAEEEYSEESTSDSPEYGPGGMGYKGQFQAFQEKYEEVELRNPMPPDSYFGWQPKVQISTLIDWTDGEASEDPTVAHQMQHVAARIVKAMFQQFRRSQTTR